MKKILVLILLLFSFAPLAKAQTPEVTQLILNIEKLEQLRKILSELKKGYEILFKGYNTIRDLSQGNFKLHEAFLDGLLEVNPAVKNYIRVKDIIACEIALVKEYGTAHKRFSLSKNLTSEELTYIEYVYKDLIAKSIKDIDALTTVLTAKKLRASDDERLKAIDGIYESMNDKLVFLRHFNSNTSLLAAQRGNENQQVQLMEKLNNVNP